MIAVRSTESAAIKSLNSPLRRLKNVLLIPNANVLKEPDDQSQSQGQTGDNEQS